MAGGDRSEGTEGIIGGIAGVFTGGKIGGTTGGALVCALGIGEIGGIS